MFIRFFAILLVVCTTPIAMAMTSDVWTALGILVTVCLGVLSVAWRVTDGEGTNPFTVVALLAALGAVAAVLLYGMSQLGVTGAYLMVGLIIVLLPVIVGWEVIRYRRKFRNAPGRCTICGYDLRASFDLCPECGQPRTDDAYQRRRIAKGLQAIRKDPLPSANQAIEFADRSDSTNLSLLPGQGGSDGGGV